MDLRKTALGIELGSTRIKAVLIDEAHRPIAQGSHEWENQLKDGVWTYSMEAIHSGLQACYAALKRDVREKFGVTLTQVGAIGVSGMMHGYLPFDRDGALLTAFRTWRNTMTGEAAEKLTELFHFNIPQRWSIAHLYQAMLRGEEHLPRLAHITTLAGYIHEKLTGVRALGVGEASGMFPIDGESPRYNQAMMAQFDALIAEMGYSWRLEDILPAVLTAGDPAGELRAEGAAFLDPEGDLRPGIPFAPPEGDAGTGMTATNSITPRTGNVSAGTSDFAMIVVERLPGVHREIDMVATPDGKPVAMAHCNNCTSDINAWVNLLGEFAQAIGAPVDKNALYTLLFNKALEGEKDCGGLMSYNYLSGEGITDLDAGCPVFARTPEARRPSLRAWRLFQDPRRGTAHALGGGVRAGLRDGNRRRGRPVRHGAAGGLQALEAGGTDARGLSERVGLLRRACGRGHGGRGGRCGFWSLFDAVSERPVHRESGC